MFLDNDQCCDVKADERGLEVSDDEVPKYRGVDLHEERMKLFTFP